ncbi:MAG: DUF1488 family protein [Candidatus Thiodiazotropha sp. (ex. Lucinisca nassula)]|nr:DUF1488 family protein [Candidatus Thiodiazotropha sp. (ex. Lucinisca nassula)]
MNMIRRCVRSCADALKKLCPQMGDAEAGFLKAFDTVRKRIHEVAAEACRRDRKGSYTYVLSAKDFNRRGSQYVA